MREHLSGRGKWQDESSKRGQLSEDTFTAIMKKHFSKPHYAQYELIKSPKHLLEIYGGTGIQPDSAIHNEQSGKTIFVEIKRQGDSGNAHERACKYFAPGIVEAAQKEGNIRKGILPFWWIFTNGIANSDKYRRKIN